MSVQVFDGDGEQVGSDPRYSLARVQAVQTLRDADERLANDGRLLAANIRLQLRNWFADRPVSLLLLRSDLLVMADRYSAENDRDAADLMQRALSACTLLGKPA